MGLILNTDFFGNDVGRIAIKFHDGNSVVDGYIAEQTGSRRYVVSRLDETIDTFEVKLAKTIEDITDLKEGQATILVYPFLNGEISEIAEHIHRIEQFVCYTVEGHRYSWKFGDYIFPPNPAYRDGSAHIAQIC